MRFAFVARERTNYPVRLLCRLMEVSPSGFHDYLRRLAEPSPDADANVREELRAVHAQSRRTYGRPRLVQALRARNHAVGHKRVARLMAEEGLRGRIKGSQRPRSVKRKDGRPAAENLLDRRFSVDSDQPAWVGDITYLATREGWMYLATVISLQTRQVLGYSLSDRMPDDLVQQAFLNAWAVCPGPPGLLFHSDRGCQYTSGEFGGTVTAHGVVQSMSRRGNCWDNAVAESFFATLKTEEATGVYETKDEARRSIANYIHGFYNPTRLHSTLGFVSPNDYAKQLKAAS